MNNNKGPSSSLNAGGVSGSIPSKMKMEEKNQLGLPMDLLGRVISFLGSSKKELENLTLTNKQLLNAVESLCQTRLKEAVKRHEPVDTDFETRLRDQTSIETNRTKPVALPWRYLLWKALHRTHLRQVRVDWEPEDGMVQQNEEESMVISPSGGKVAISNGDRIYIAEMTSMNILYRAIHESLLEVLWLDDSSFLTRSNDEIFSWKQEHETWTRTEINLGWSNHVSGWATQNNRTVIFLQQPPTLGEDSFHVRSVNVQNGLVSTLFTIDVRQQGYEASVYYASTFVCDNTSLLIHFLSAYSHAERKSASVTFICNLQTNKQVQFLKHTEGSSMNQALDSPHTFFVESLTNTHSDPFTDSTLSLFKIGNDGLLSPTGFSFPTAGRDEDVCSVDAASASRVICSRGIDIEEMVMYNAKNGAKLVSLSGLYGFFYFTVAMSVVRNELLIMNTGDDFRSVIKAFCLP